MNISFSSLIQSSTASTSGTTLKEQLGKLQKKKRQLEASAAKAAANKESAGSDSNPKTLQQLNSQVQNLQTRIQSAQTTQSAKQVTTAQTAQPAAATENKVIQNNVQQQEKSKGNFG